ncbi:F5/8 type C domain protein [compost metagenome]
MSAASRPVGIPAAVRYWRILNTETNDTGPGGQNSYITISEINFRPIIGTPATMSGTGTPTASSTYTTAAGWEAPKAIDGVNTTAWICQAGLYANSWWRFVYTNPIEIKQLALTSYPTAAGAVQMVKSGFLQKSFDGNTWYNVLSFTNQTAWASAGETRLFSV